MKLRSRPGAIATGLSLALACWATNLAAQEASAATASEDVRWYKYDDGTLEWTGRVVDAEHQEFAQRFRLPEAGRVVEVEVCFKRGSTDTSSEVRFKVALYTDDNGFPGSELGSSDASGRIWAAGQSRCFLVSNDRITSVTLPEGDSWMGVSWRPAYPWNNTKLIQGDIAGPGGTKTVYRAQMYEHSNWSPWIVYSIPSAYGLRMAVAHQDR